MSLSPFTALQRIIMTVQSVAEWARSGDSASVAEALVFAPSPRRGRKVEEELVDSAGFTPLLLAAWHGHAHVISCLLDAGADINRRLQNGASALYLAARNGHAGAVGVLLQGGAEVEFGATRHSDGSTVLHTAAKHGRLDVLRVLLEEPAARTLLEAEDLSASTPLLVAVARGHAAATGALLDAGAVVTQGSAHRPCATVLSAYQADHPVLKALLAHFPPCVDMALPNGATALHVAALRGDEATCQLLLAAGANPSRMRIDGKTATVLAMKFGHRALAEVLRQAGLDRERAARGNRGNRAAALRKLRAAGLNRGLAAVARTFERPSQDTPGNGQGAGEEAGVVTGWGFTASATDESTQQVPSAGVVAADRGMGGPNEFSRPSTAAQSSHSRPTTSHSSWSDGARQGGSNRAASRGSSAGDDGDGMLRLPSISGLPSGDEAAAGGDGDQEGEGAPTDGALAAEFFRESLPAISPPNGSQDGRGEEAAEGVA
eukprot:COSAG05_NODE_442_length_9803_cov_28.091921_2_plen_490_part_00